MYYYNNELPPQQGWVCPKCGRVNAPWMPTCGCTTPTFTADGITYLNVKECIKEAEQAEPITSGVIWTEEAVKDEAKSYTTWASTEPSTERHLPDYSYESGMAQRLKDSTDCPWK